jgi:hypothetical protein
MEEKNKNNFKNIKVKIRRTDYE